LTRWVKMLFKHYIMVIIPHTSEAGAILNASKPLPEGIRELKNCKLKGRFKEVRYFPKKVIKQLGLHYLLYLNLT